MDGTRSTRSYRPVRPAPALPPPKRRFTTSSAGVRPDTFTDVIAFAQSDLAIAPPSGVPDFLLLDSVKNDPIVLSIPLPLSVDFGDTVQIMLNGALVDTPIDVDPFFDANIITIELSAAARQAQPEGKVSINYQITFHSGGGKTEDGPDGQFYTTDFTVPGKPFLGQLVVSDLVVENGVTPAAMEVDGDGVEYLAAKVPSYGGSGPADVIHGLIGTAEEQLDAAPDTDGGYEVRFLRSFIEANEDGDGDGRPDGQLNFSYIITKRSGIKSDAARPLTLGVLLQDAFAPPTPRIPAYDDDADPKLIDLADARAEGGLIVEIGGDANYVAQDQIFVLWDTAEIGPFLVTDETSNPVANIGIPFAAIRDSWLAATSGADTGQTVSVSYEVRRGGMVAGRPDTPHSVIVNLHEAGGTDPDPETPENDNLTKPSLKSASGGDNDIPPGDADKDATVTVPWTLKDPAGASAFAIGDLLIGLYADTPFAQQPITALPAADIELTLSGSIIKNNGSGAKLLAFAIVRTLAAGGTNTSVSPSQEIIVHGSDELPGGGDLGAGTVPEAVGTDANKPDRLMIGKDQGKDGTDFIIEPYANQNTGDTISLTMTVFRGFYAGGHPGDASPQPGRDVTIDGIHPTGTGSQTIVHLEETQLMRYDLDSMPLHAHLVYTVSGANTTDRPVTSGMLVMDIDPRGDN